MKVKAVLGAMLVSVALCSSSFGFELLSRLMGSDSCAEGQCGECAACKACAPATCRPAVPCCGPAVCKPCAPVCKPCAPVCAKPCAPVCGKLCCEKVGCEGGCKQHATPLRNMLDNIKGMLRSKGGCGCDSGCGETCGNDAGYVDADSHNPAPAPKKLAPAPSPEAAPAAPAPAE